MTKTESFITAPVRLCCGQPHFGVVCPDGLVMCCLCFKRVPQTELNTDSDGDPENVCKKCAAEEIEMKKAREKQ